MKTNDLRYSLVFGLYGPAGAGLLGTALEPGALGAVYRRLVVLLEMRMLFREKRAPLPKLQGENERQEVTVCGFCFLYGFLLGLMIGRLVFVEFRAAAWEKQWDGSVRCTRCKYRTRIDTDYCPNCGGIMRRKKENGGK